MKKLLKPIMFGVLAVCLVLVLFGCNNDKAGLQENDEWNNNPGQIQRNKENAHAPLISYDDTESAIKADRQNSPYFQSLNGEWKFSLKNKVDEVNMEFVKSSFSVDDWQTITVPSNWELQGFSAPTYTKNTYLWDVMEFSPAHVPDDNEIGLYRREIEVPADWNGREVYISFEGVESACYVYVNGNMVGYGEDTYTTKDFRITPYINYGKTNTVAVKVFKYSDASWLEAQDSLKLGGIYRDVYLYSAPKTQIKDVYFDIQMDKNFQDALIKVSADVGAYDKAPENSHVLFSLFDAEDVYKRQEQAYHLKVIQQLTRRHSCRSLRQARRQ